MIGRLPGMNCPKADGRDRPVRVKNRPWVLPGDAETQAMLKKWLKGERAVKVETTLEEPPT
jgi:hypothetical protein